MSFQIDASRFFLEMPLYSEVEWKKEDVFDVLDLLFFNGNIDGYCLECDRESTFHGENGNIPQQLTLAEFNKNKRKSSAVGIRRHGGTLFGPTPPLIEPGVYRVSLGCTRNATHKYHFIYLIYQKPTNVEKEKIEIQQYSRKIGQHPSLAELNQPAIKKYRKSLPTEVYSDLSRAIGLASHDVGIGAFVYLRRVFEYLVEKSHEAIKETEGWNESSYHSMRMIEKIKSLSGYLPNFLVENTEIYGVLSKGIHELSEKECLKYFPVIKVGIELILDEAIEKLERDKKINEASRALNIVSSELK